MTSCLCFDIVFAKLGAIPRAKIKFVEIVAAAEHYSYIKEISELKKQSFRICLPVIICVKPMKEYQ